MGGIGIILFGLDAGSLTLPGVAGLGTLRRAANVEEEPVYSLTFSHSSCVITSSVRKLSETNSREQKSILSKLHFCKSSVLLYPLAISHLLCTDLHMASLLLAMKIVLQLRSIEYIDRIHL